MDWENLDDAFSEFSDGMLALLSGIAIIITITFIIYEVWPLLSDQRMIFVFSISALIVSVVASISFYLSSITMLPDVVGKLITGLTVAIFGVILFHVSRTYGISSLPEIVLLGFLGFASALPLAKGVLVPLLGEDTTFEVSGSDEEEFEDIEEEELEGIEGDEDEFEYEIEEDIEGDEDEFEYEIDEVGEDAEEPEEEEDFSQENEPW